MVKWIIGEKMGATCWETDQDLILNCIAFVRNVVIYMSIRVIHGAICYRLSKGERTECKNYKGISLLSGVGKIYAVS